MAAVPEQDFKSHRRWLPMYHFVILPLLILNFVFATWHAFRIPTRWNIWTAVAAFAIAMGVAYGRVMANTVQDRVIRLEMRLRLKDVLTGALAARVSELTRKQMVGLRFASDAELPGLVERCLSGELATDEDVKKQIKNWQADWLRA